MGSHVAQGGPELIVELRRIFELVVLLLLSPRCWNWRCVLLCPHLIVCGTGDGTVALWAFSDYSMHWAVCLAPRILWKINTCFWIPMWVVKKVSDLWEGSFGPPGRVLLRQVREYIVLTLPWVLGTSVNLGIKVVRAGQVQRQAMRRKDRVIPRVQIRNLGFLWMN